MPRGAVLEGYRAPGLDPSPVIEANRLNAEVFLRKQQQALHDRSLKQQAEADAEKQRQENYKYGVKIIQNPELQKGVPVERQPKLLADQQALLDDLAREFHAGGNPSMGELDMKYGGKVNQLLQLKAGMSEAEKNIGSVAGGLKTIPGVSSEKAEQFLRKNVFKPDGSMGDYTAEGLQKLLEDNAGEIVVDNSAAKDYRKNMGKKGLLHDVYTRDANGKITSKKVSSQLYDDMTLDENGIPIVRSSKWRLNQVPTQGKITVGGNVLNGADEQIHAQTQLRGALQKDDIRFLDDDVFSSVMQHEGFRKLIKSVAHGSKDHFAKEYKGERFTTNPAVNDLLEKAVAYDLLNGASDPESKDVDKVLQPAPPKITINNGKNDNAEAVDWFSGSNLSPEDQGKSLTARFDNLKAKSKANGFTLTSLGDKNMAEYLRNVAKGAVTDEVAKKLDDNAIAITKNENGDYVLYIAKNGKFNFNDDASFIGTVDQAGFNEFMNTRYGAYSPSKRKVTTPGIARPGAGGGQGQGGKVRVNIGGKIYEMPASGIEQMKKDGVKYTIVN